MRPPIVPKRCTHCRKGEPEVSFYPSEKQYLCIPCSRAYQRAHYVPKPRKPRAAPASGAAACEMDALTRAWGRS